MTIVVPRNVGCEKNRIATPNLPPPYTYAGKRGGQLR